ncbi:hypothetical protein [Fibrella aquatica]|jgi:hypothetical protein|uniref:hypothetical protein n=1 Tax=Fibrella aquatica TaxID=3242487 RepID=UPI003520475E
MIERLIKFTLNYPLDIISYLFLLLPVFVAIYRRELLDKVLFLAVIYFLVRFLEESALLYYSLLAPSTISLQKGLLVIDVILIAQLYYFALEGQNLTRKAGLFFSFITLVVIVVTYFYSEYASIGASLLRVLIIFFSLSYFNKILSENRILRIVHHPMFWVNASILLYGMGTFMIWLFIDYLLDMTKTSDQTFDLFWNMGQIIVIIQCIVSAVGIWATKFDRDNYIQSV